MAQMCTDNKIQHLKFEIYPRYLSEIFLCYL